MAMKPTLPFLKTGAVLFSLVFLSSIPLYAQPDILVGVELERITAFETNPNISALKMSADGSTIVYATSGPEVKVYTLGTDGNGLQLVYDFQRTGTGPRIDISANGEKVIWTDGVGEIFIANKDGSGLDELATLIPNPDTNFADLEPVIPRPPRITADGSQVLFINMDRDPRASGVWKVNADNSSLTQVFNYLEVASDVFGTDGSEYNFNSAFTDGFDISADGSRMIFGTRIFKLLVGDLTRGDAVFAIGDEFYDIGEFAIGNQPFAIDYEGEHCIMYRLENIPGTKFEEINVYWVPLGTGDPVKVIGGLDIFGTSAFTQMSAVGGRAITWGANGRLPISMTYRTSAYAFDLVSVDPVTIPELGFRLSESSLPSINGNGDRFCFLANSIPPQIWMGSINATGEATQPQINGVRFEPNFVAADFSAPATLSAYAEDIDHPIQRVTFESFQDGFLAFRALRSDPPYNGILVDDGTTGDEEANDKRYTNNTVNKDLVESPTGEYTIRIAAINNTLREITFVDATPFFIRDTTVTSVRKRELPGWVLHPNYPNPFRNETVIRYELPYQARVTLRMLDGSGREVACLFNGIQAAGPQQVVFDATNLPPGTYYYALAVGDDQKVVEMVKQ